MHPSAKAAGSFMDVVVGALTILAVFAVVGLIAIAAAVTGHTLYFFIMYATPYIVELCDIFTLWLADIL